MKKTSFCTVFFATLLFTALAVGLTAQTLGQELEQFTKNWEDAYNRADYEALAGMYTTEYVVVNADGTTKTSTSVALGAEYAKAFGETKGHITIKPAGAEALPDGKVRITGTFSGSTTDNKSGETTNWSGSYEHLTVKDNGRWKLTQTKVARN